MTIDPVLLLVGMNFAAVVLYIARFDNERAHWWVLQLVLYLAGSVLSAAQPTLAWGIIVLGVGAVVGCLLTAQVYGVIHPPSGWKLVKPFGNTPW